MIVHHDESTPAAGAGDTCGCEHELTPADAGALVHGSPDWHRAASRAKQLSWLSLAYMGAEGGVGIIAGILAGSVALLGFGLDSLIEGLASVIVIWRFSNARTLSETAEGRAQKAVAVSFFFLAPYIAFDAVRTLLAHGQAQTSWVGIALSAASIVWMPILGRMKRRLGAQLGSAATTGEGAQNLLCAYLAAGVLVGLVANVTFGLWWVDPVIGLGIAALAIKEGLDAWRGEDCSC